MPIIFATKVSSAWSAVLLIGLAASAHQAWSANLYTTVSDMFPKKECRIGDRHGRDGRRGSAVRFFRSVVGMVVDHYKYARRPTRGGYSDYFWRLRLCLHCIAFLIHHLLAPRFVQVRERIQNPRRLWPDLR